MRGRTPSFPKFIVQPTKALDYPDFDEYLLHPRPEGNETTITLYNSELAELKRETIKDLFGEPAKWPEGVQDDFKLKNNQVNEALPKVWLSIEMLCKTSNEEINELPNIDPSASLDNFDSTELLTYFYTLSRQFDAMEPVATEHWTRFENVFSRLEVKAYIWNHAVNTVIDHCLSWSAETAALVSEQQVEHVRHRHSANGHECGGFPPSVQGNYIENDYDHHHLLAFQPDQGQHFYFDALIQFWIDKERMKPYQLGNALVTFDGS